MKYILILILALNAYGLTIDQSNKLRIAYNIGKQIKTINEFTFERTLCAIMLQESSAGGELIGDKYKNGRLKNLYDSSLGIFQIKLSTAKFIIKSEPYLKFHFSHLLKGRNKTLVNLLLTSIEFSTIIAGYYLKHNYEIAYRRGYKNPWHSAISSYNGGWHNEIYLNKIMIRLEYVKKQRIF